MKPRNWTNIFKRFRGKWVAIKSDGETVIASGTSLRRAKAAADKKGCQDVYLTCA